MIRKKIIIILFIYTILSISVNTDSYCLTELNIFKSRIYSDEGLEKAAYLIPEKWIESLPSLKSKDLFQSIRDNSIYRREPVRKFIYLYLTRGRDYVRRALEKANIYHEIIYKLCKKNTDIPPELSLLPLLESGFNPNAVSRSDAVGLWQFLKGTSLKLSLKINNWVDERKDIEKSTLAAFRHLKNLYKIFNSWELALASYNGGASYVKKAIINSGKKDFWELHEAGLLRNETAEFVPRFAALLIIYENQDALGLRDELKTVQVPETKNFIFTDTVNILKLSKLLEVPVAVIKSFNPELKKTFTPPQYKKYSLRLPISINEKLKNIKRSLYTVKIKKLKKHIVKKGETIYEIAKRYKAQPELIIAINEIKNPNRIKTGRKLYIPI